jgi:enoyl-CoA hydratase/carnithine racemase
MSQLSNELFDLCEGISQDEEVRVLVLTGCGEKPFNMEIDWIEATPDTHEGLSNQFCSITEPIAKVGQPIIAAIYGDVIGQGLELALACDVRIAQETSRFGLPHIGAGLIPWNGGTQWLPRLVGRGKAMEMILTGEIIDAQEAHRIGLVNRVVPPDQLMSVAMNIAREMATKAPIALRYAKEAIHKGMDMTLEQGLRLEADLYFLLHATVDRTEGIKALRDKKKPQFEGR